MCDPVVAAVLTIGQGVMSYVQAENEESAAKGRNATLRANADAAYRRDMAILDRRQQEEAEKSGQELFKAKIESMENRATKQVRLGEAGITGLSVDAILADTEMQAGMANQTIQRNFTSTVAALNDDRTRAYATLANRYAQQEQPVGGNILGTLISTGASIAAIPGIGDALKIPSIGSTFGNSFGMGRSAMVTSPVMGNLRPSNFGTPGMNFGGASII
tara:strand:+ start:20120 stop:20773 length:654 start_codon:yes stop_codon:yes gene_type:complete